MKNKREEEEAVTRLYDYSYHRKRQNQIFPDPVPTPTHLPDTAEHAGRYSVGSHSVY
jgi:hypothetical protein